MQGQQSAIGSLPDTLGFNLGSTSTSSEGAIDQQLCWTNLRNPLPDFAASSDETYVPYLNPASQERQNIMEWSLGESSSTIAHNHVGGSEQKTDHGWSSIMSTNLVPSNVSDQQQHGSSDILSLSNIEVNLNSVQMANSNLFSQGSSSTTIPHDLNTNSGFEDHHHDYNHEDNYQVMECTPAYRSDGRPGKEQMPSASTSSYPFPGPSGTNRHLMDVSDGTPGSSLEGRRLSCKRKALEEHLGQSSGSGATNYLSHAENSFWHSVHSSHSMNTGASFSSPIESSRGINLAEQVNPRLGLTMGGAISESPLGLPASGIAGSSHRNFRLRINGSDQQNYIPSNLFTAVGDAGNVNFLSEQHSRIFHNNSVDLRSMSVGDNGNPQGQPSVVHLPSLVHSQARWNVAPSSRTSSSSSFPVSVERDSGPYEEHNSSAPRSISQHPMFIHATDVRNFNQNPANWSLPVGNISFAGNVASSSRSGANLGSHSSSPSWVPHITPPLYSRGLSEYVRRSLLSSAGTENGGRNGNSPPLRLSSATSQEMALSGNHGRRPSSSRSTALLERHLNGGIGVPYSWRTPTAASEGRSRLVSEICTALDLMRRGEGLRLEDVMILDPSVFFGMTDIHDRHRDMRLDVDNMSYEELLALEERIGSVSTGLSEETISSSLKHRKYICVRPEPEPEQSVDTEPCCICQEEYNDGEDLGTLSCGHDFHIECIKQWLKHKNLCPICKTTGLTT